MSKIQTEILKSGDSRTFPKKGCVVRVHYEGWFTDGSKFDSSKDRNEPFTFQLGVNEVIPAFEDTVAKMSLGQKVRITTPPQFAYGKQGLKDTIPPDTALVFEIELLAVLSLY